jgi:hypothetical protein
MARRDSVGIRLLTRNSHDWSRRYPLIVEGFDDTLAGYRRRDVSGPDRQQNQWKHVPRWLLQANPDLTKVLREVCGDAILDDPTQMVRLAEHVEDRGIQERVRAAKRANKVASGRSCDCSAGWSA